MSNSTSQITQILSSQADKEATANENFDAASTGMTYGRNAETSAGLTWGYYGGVVLPSGVPVQVSNGTVALTPSTTNYIYYDGGSSPAGGVICTTSIPAGWPGPLGGGDLALYSVVTDADSATSWLDYRGWWGASGSAGSQGAQGAQGAQGVAGSGAQGAQGFQGEAGILGLDGLNGVNGAQGAQGFQGAGGATGSAAISQSQEVTATGAGTFNVPAGVTLVWVTMMGAGAAGGGSNQAASGGGGGGAGESVVGQPYITVGGGTVAYSVGAKGTGVAASDGNAGGSTTFGVLIALGGLGGKGGGATGNGGVGGGPRGATGGTRGNPATAGGLGTAEAVTAFGGSSGGGGGSAVGANGAAGGGSGGILTGGAGGTTAASQAGGGGGAATIYGTGGAGGNGGAGGSAATGTFYGAGGGGAGGIASSSTGGNGADGYLLVEWIG